MQFNLVRLFLVSGTLTLGYGSVFTLLAEIRTRFGFEDWAIGWIGGAGFAAGFVAQVALSRYADRGYQRLMLVGGVLSGLLGMLGMAVATELWEFIVSRLLLGLGSGTFSPAVRRIAVIRDPERAGETLGRMMVFELGGFLIGPVLASVLNELLGLRAPFIALAAMLAVAVPVVARTRLEEGVVSTERRVVRSLLTRRTIWACLLAAIAFYLTVGVFEATWAIFLSDRGASQLFIGATLSLFSLPMLFIPPYAGRLAQRIGPMRVIPISIGVAIVCMCGYAVFDALIALAIVVAVHSVVDAFTMPANQLAVARATPPDQIAAGQGLLGALGLATAAATAAVGGWVYGSFGAFVLYGGTAVLMAVLLVAAWHLGDELR
ncbi:MAG: MFS transporter [Myxococcales bacterium]|nr:MFS transporter [Myxococcales bacterium]